MKKLRSLLCRLPMPFWFHNVTVVEEFDSCRRKLKCKLCGRYFAMCDHHEAVLPWDDEYEKIICDMYGLSRTKR